MASQVANVPRPHELLCEFCGYGLDGLPSSALCPECGKPVAASTLAPQRHLSAWETPGMPLPLRFLRTTAAVLGHPSGFFRQTASRGDPKRSLNFARAHYFVSGYFFALAATMHYLFFLNAAFGHRLDLSETVFAGLAGASLLCPVAFVTITGIRALAAFLSALESKYHGLRLPLPVVQRALHFHAAHLLPVAIITAALTTTYRVGTRVDLIPRTAEIPYLYLLSAWIVLAAGYLFWTYWMAMKAIMYANR